MTKLYDFEDQLLSYLENFRQQIQSRPLNLGGVSGSGGGSGGPPGGFVGQLPQSRVTFDSTEAESMSIPSSGASLLDNLNRIRYRIKQVETVLSGGFALTIKENDLVVSNGVLILDFINGIINDVGNNEVEIYIPRSGGAASNFYDLDDVPHFYTGNSGKILVVKSGEDGLEYIDRTFTNLIDTPNSYSSHANKFVKVNNSETGLVFSNTSLLDLSDTPNSYSAGLYLKSTTSGFILDTASTSFLTLSDTFSDYVGRGGQFLIVDPYENGITSISGEFIFSFTSLMDTPGSYTGQSGKAVVVNQDETGLEFITISGLDRVGIDILYNNIPFLDNVTKLNINGGIVTYEGPGHVSLSVSGGGNVIAVKNNDTPFVSAVDTLNFVGFNLTQTGFTEVTISGTGGAGSGTFISLTDTPATYSGQANRFLKVTNAENGIEFIDLNVTTSGGITVWYPDAPPDNPHIKDDEFNDGVLASKWTVFDIEGAISSYEEGDYGLKIVQSGQLPYDKSMAIAGFLQPIPTSSTFSCWTKVSTTAFHGTEGKVGMILTEGTTSTDKIIAFWFNNTITNPCYLQLEEYTNYNTYDSGVTRYFDFLPNYIYLRARVDSNYARLDTSLDGFTWFNVFAAYLSGFNLSYIGIGVKRQSSNAAPYVGDFVNYARFFRFYENDNNVNTVPRGNFVSLGGSGIVAGSNTFIGLSDTPNSYSGNELKFLRVNSLGTGVEFASVSGSAKDYFLELLDTPNSYLGQANKAVRVKPDESGLEFFNFTISGGGSSTFTGLTDTPNTYTGNQGRSVRVKNTADGLEFFRPFPGVTVIKPNVLTITSCENIRLGSGLGLSLYGNDFYNNPIAEISNEIINFTSLYDTPTSYIGQGGKFTRVKLDESGLEFVNISGIGSGLSSGYGNVYCYIDGVLSSAQSVYTYVAPTNLSIDKIFISLGNFGNSGSTVIDINKNGTSVLSSPISIPYNYSYNVYDLNTSIILSQGDIVTIDIDSAAAGAENLSITLRADNGFGVTRTNVIGGVYWYVDGILASGLGIYSYVVPSDIKLKNLFASLTDFGSAGSTVIDINKNGTSIFSTQPSIPYNHSSSVYNQTLDIDLAQGDILTLDIDAVASGALNLAVSLEATSLATLSGGASYFVDLLDVPSSYTGHGGKVVAVNQSENALEFITISGGTTSISYFNPDSEPSSLGSISDEFEINTISNWTEFDPDDRVTFSIQNGYLKGVLDYYGGHENRVSLLKSIPSGDFTIETHTYLSAEFIKYRSVGLVLQEGTGASSDMFVIDLTLDDSVYDSIRVEVDHFYDYQSINNILAQIRHLQRLDVFLRFARSGSTYYAYYSDNGISWLKLWSGTLGFTPTYFGLGMANRVGGGDKIVGYFEYFRYWDQFIDYDDDLNIKRAKIVV